METKCHGAYQLRRTGAASTVAGVKDVMRYVALLSNTDACLFTGTLVPTHRVAVLIHTVGRGLWSASSISINEIKCHCQSRWV